MGEGVLEGGNAQWSMRAGDPPLPSARAHRKGCGTKPGVCWRSLDWKRPVNGDALKPGKNRNRCQGLRKAFQAKHLLGGRTE